MRGTCYQIAFVFFCASILLAQDGSGSLVDAARKARDSKAKSKVVITDENLNSDRGPLPDINIEGVDNSDDIVKAIDQYRRTHTLAETEHVIRDWYNRYDLLFQHAFAENEELRLRAQDRSVEPHEYSDDYVKYREQRSSEIHSQLQDSRTTQKNGLLMARLQQTLQKVRSAIFPFGLKYDWMKIRFGNGNGSW
jgi:hypothetical protein